MDWYIIEYLYPNSFKLFIDTMFPSTGILSISVLKNYDIKKLYNFFDKQEIYLILELHCSNRWNYGIQVNNWYISSDVFEKTREDIEAEGFTYCFKKLEEKICKKLTV